MEVREVLSIIVLVLVLGSLSIAIRITDLIDNSNERKTMEEYCKIECKKLISHK